MNNYAGTVLQSENGVHVCRFCGSWQNLFISVSWRCTEKNRSDRCKIPVESARERTGCAYCRLLGRKKGCPGLNGDSPAAFFAEQLQRRSRSYATSCKRICQSEHHGGFEENCTKASSSAGYCLLRLWIAFCASARQFSVRGKPIHGFMAVITAAASAGEAPAAR